MVYIFAATEAERAALRQSLHKFAEGQYDSLTAVTVDPLYFPGLPAKLGLGNPPRLPAGAVHRLTTNQVFPYPEGRPLDYRSLQGWGLDVWQGRVRAWAAPGAATTTLEDLGPTRVATRRVSINAVPGLNLKKYGAGRDEL
jgi:protein disulfide-isomerase A1